MSDTSPSALGRYAELARLLVRYGRSDLVGGAGLGDYLVDDDTESAPLDEREARLAERLPEDLERLGPTYVKLGQLLSTRYDLLPAAYTDSLARLQDAVTPFDFADATAIIEEDLGARLRHLFDEIDPTPIGAASLGQVHRAITRSGRDVVVKVQRPGVRDLVREDMTVLTRLAEFADRHTDTGRSYGLTGLLAQFRRSLTDELDYRKEAANLERFGALTKPYPRLIVPGPLRDYSSSRVLTMDRIEGRKVDEISPYGLLDIDASGLVDELFRAYLRMILVDGILHADPHPGNILLTPDGRLALLDLGMVATVPPRVQERVTKLLIAIGDGDGEEAAQVLAGMGHPLENYDAAAFRDDVTHLVSSTVAMGADLQAGAVLVQLSRLSGQHGLRPPAEMSMIGKALLNLDRTTGCLDPAFAPAEAIRANLGEIMRGGLSVSPGGAMAAAIEAKEFAAQLPKRANRIMDALAEGELSLRVHAFDEQRLVQVLQALANRLTMGLVIAAMIIGAAMLMQVPTTARILGYPALAILLFLAAAVAGALLVASIAVTDRKMARRRRDLRPPRG